MLALAIEMNAERQVLRGLEKMEFFFQEKCIAAQINVFLARYQACNDLSDLRMQQRFAARDRHHRCAAFIYGFEAFLGRELALQNMRRILNFAASSAGEVAAEQRREHQAERVVAASSKPLPDEIRRHRPHLGNRNTHPYMLSGSHLAFSF